MNNCMNLENFLIVSGNGRNSGKTSFITDVINQVSVHHPITAIKVSPHIHPSSSPTGLMVSSKNFLIARETSEATDKDTGRMLKAGASVVYYIEATDEYISDAFNKLMNMADLNGPVICESGGLRNIIAPSLLILLNKNDGRKEKDGFRKLLPVADKVIFFGEDEYNSSIQQLRFIGGRWEIKSEH